MATPIELPAPFRGNTHILVGFVRENPESSIEMRFVLGTLDADGDFVADPYMKRITMVLHKGHADAIRQRAADAGAPVGPLGQEWRVGDMWGYLTDISFDVTNDPIA